MKDWILEMLVNTVESAERKGPDSGGMQITLCVGGVLVSGQMISCKLYFQLLADGAIPDLLEKADKSDALPEVDPDFVHLASAKFLFGEHNPIPTANGVLWRCRLDSVDGFHLGELISKTID